VNKLNRILVGVLAFQVLLVLFVSLRGEDTSIGKLEPLLPGFAADKIERIRIFDRTAKSDVKTPDEAEDDAATKGKPGAKPSIDLVKKGDAWILASHFDYPVDKQKVTELAEKIADMRSRAPIASGKARQAQLEVADEAYQRKVVITAGGKDTTFYVGSSAGQRQTSVRIAGSDEIHGVAGLTAGGVGAQASAWVDTGYVDVQPDRLASLEVVNDKGSFHFERSGETWQASVGGQPVTPAKGMELNKGEIDKVVNRVSKIYLSQPADAKRAIDKPLATVTLHLKAEPPPVAADAGAQESTAETAGQDRVIEIAASDKKDRYYVREKGRAQAALVDALSITDLIELSSDRLTKKFEEKKEPAPGAEGDMGGMPPGMGGMPPGMEGLPPGMEGLPPGMEEDPGEAAPQ
jgi:hypothetical protein